MAQFPPPSQHGPGVTIVIHKGPPPNQMWDHAASRLDAMDTGQNMQAKGDVNYRHAESGHACGNCDHYRVKGPGETSGTCELVSGTIEAAMLCDLWEAQPKPGAATKGSHPIGKAVTAPPK